MEKKKMKIWKKILIGIVVIIILFLIVTLRKFIILSHLEKISQNIANSNNYYAEVYTSQGDSITIRKSYNKDSNYLTTIEVYGVNIPEIRKITLYKNKDEQVGVIQAGENKIAILNSENVGGLVGINSYSTDGMSGIWKIQLAAISKITTEDCSNKECYLIESTHGWKTWVDKESGLIVREINGGIVSDFNYTFNSVKDGDISKPNISDCKIQENN